MHTTCENENLSFYFCFILLLFDVLLFVARFVVRQKQLFPPFFLVQMCFMKSSPSSSLIYRSGKNLSRRKFLFMFSSSIFYFSHILRTSSFFSERRHSTSNALKVALEKRFLPLFFTLLFLLAPHPQFKMPSSNEKLIFHLFNFFFLPFSSSNETVKLFFLLSTALRVCVASSFHRQRVIDLHMHKNVI